ncbi:hypothetical protein [Streptomyces spinoverrucosus]|uniref:hypothetical protein n=1 Tax=Streptomyces spinoverrucosus TaxID=284043 RepID=UPI0027DA7700|nr:hypothetical protein [Streptomyces spinoverrucosus]
MLLAVALAVVAIRPSLLLDRLPGGDASVSAPSPLPAETALPSSAPGDTAQAGLPTLDEPFRGSPARAWAEGADAIELPAAKAVGDMSKAEVALALRLTKEFLVAGNLDPAVLRGGQPTEAMALLDPKQPGMLADARRSLRSPDREHDPVNLFSRFDPDEVQPAGDVVKVRGHMTFEAGKPGQVRVHADYTFVYPLVRAEGGDEQVERTIVQRDLTVLLSDPGRWQVTEGRLQVEGYVGEYYNVECEVHDGYLHPSFPTTGPTGAPPAGPAIDPYDRSRSVSKTPGEAECGKVTRT